MVVELDGSGKVLDPNGFVIEALESFHITGIRSNRSTNIATKIMNR